MNLPFLRVLLLLCTAYISYQSGKEYVQVSFKHQAPSHPFGHLEKWTDMADSYLKTGFTEQTHDYGQFMLSVCIGATLVFILLLMTWFVEKMVKYAYLTLILFTLYFAWHKFLG